MKRRCEPEFTINASLVWGADRSFVADGLRSRRQVSGTEVGENWFTFCRHDEVLTVEDKPMALYFTHHSIPGVRWSFFGCRPSAGIADYIAAATNVTLRNRARRPHKLESLAS